MFFAHTFSFDKVFLVNRNGNLEQICVIQLIPFGVVHNLTTDVNYFLFATFSDLYN